MLVPWGEILIRCSTFALHMAKPTGAAGGSRPARSAGSFLRAAGEIFCAWEPDSNDFCTTYVDFTGPLFSALTRLYMLSKSKWQVEVPEPPILYGVCETPFLGHS